MNRRSFLKTAGAAAATSPLLAKGAVISKSQVPSACASAEKDPLLAIPIGNTSVSPEHITLTGTWRIKLDPAALGVTDRWFKTEIGPDMMYLPGSTDQAGYGDKTCGPADGHLSRPYEYTGPVWYQTEFIIPETWRGQHITLCLERCHWQTSAWVDGKPYGSHNSLSVPHIYDLGVHLEPGTHALTLCVDNTIRINIGATAHAITAQTQTDWNGVIGKIQLRSTPPVWIEEMRAFPDIEAKQVVIEFLLRNETSSPASGKIEAILQHDGSKTELNVSSFTGQSSQSMTLAIKSDISQWDDLQPSLCKVDICFISDATGNAYRHKQVLQFGMRKITIRDRQFILNGRAVFLRGTVENAVFPLTAYPAMGMDEWRRIYRVLKAYGMNHMRFHSYCPPEAAFAAADEAGILLHVELPVFSHHIGTTPGLEEFMRQEAHRILKTYGNHPSFTFLCMGNELRADFSFLDQLVAELKSADNRRLYTYSTNNGRNSPGPTSEYWVTEETPEGRLRIDRTRFGSTPGGTDYDFSKAIAPYHVPVVAHELGQWAVYPSYDELDKYTGVLKPRNLEVFRKELSVRGMGDQAEIFQSASGRFSAEVYKEDIESAIRTPDFGGFQLLELTDYPGQHEALVGMLDCFWDSKHLITANAFRKFCNDTVPLLRFSKFVWQSNEVFRAKAEIAHYGKGVMEQPLIQWSIADDTGRQLHSGRLRTQRILAGEITSLGEIEIPLRFVHQAGRFTLTLELQGAKAKNSWEIWVYPASLAIPKPAHILMTTKLDEVVAQYLQQGGTVFLSAPFQQKGSHLLKMRFLPVFWSFGMFKKQPGVMGILCDPAHPAFASFPTDMHSNWQWWELTEGTNAFILDDMPLSFRPLVQVIDDFHRNHRLGMVIEANVGKGKILATSLYIGGNLEEKTVTRQMLYSLLRYLSSESFQPEASLEISSLRALFPA